MPVFNAKNIQAANQKMLGVLSNINSAIGQEGTKRAYGMMSKGTMIGAGVGAGIGAVQGSGEGRTFSGAIKGAVTGANIGGLAGLGRGMYKELLPLKGQGYKTELMNASKELMQASWSEGSAYAKAKMSGVKNAASNAMNNLG